MVLVCPGCQAKVVTVTGHPLDTVACGNCGTEFPVPPDPDAPRPAPPASEPPAPRSWWRRLFG